MRYVDDTSNGEHNVAFSAIYTPLLTLVPQHFVLNPWTTVTSTFVEQSVAGFLFTFLTLLFAGRYCERIWGGKQLFKFLAIQICVSNIVTLTVIYISFALSSSDDSDSPYLIARPIYGGIALQLAYLVAFKQMIPEHAVVFLNDMGRIQVRYLPFSALILYTVTSIALRRPAMMLLAWSGFFVSWIYLRYFRISQIQNILPLTEDASSTANQATIKGDPSDSFAFAEFFFPAPLHDVVEAIADSGYKVLLRFGLVPNHSEIQSANAGLGITTMSFSSSPPPANRATLANNNSVESDRRRELALKVLNSKLHSNAPEPGTSPLPSPPTTLAQNDLE